MQDFEGQKLADLLATLVLSASGVSFRSPHNSSPHPLYILTRCPSTSGPLLHNRLSISRYQARGLRRLGRNRPHIPPRRAPLAFLQTTPDQVVGAGI